MADSELETSGDGSGSNGAVEAAIYRKVSARLLPILFISYVVAYLDRVNIGFAKLQMLGELRFSDTVFGFGAGVFFVGYFLFEVPSNVLLVRVGARAWIARIMISWGVISALTMFVKTPPQFYVMRFLLGAAEAGFFPGIIFYLTCWYPAARRGRWTATFMTAVPISGVLGGPLSGWVLKSFEKVGILSSWQWMLLLEGLPSILVGGAVLALLDDGVDQAAWLSDDEKQLLKSAVSREQEAKTAQSVGAVLRDLKVWWMSAIYFAFVMGLYGVTFWLPTIIKSIPIADAMRVGFLSAIPYTIAAITMVLVARHADVTRERRWHVAVPAVVGALGLVASTFFAHELGFALAALTLATAGIITTLPTFWSLPTSILGGTAAAAGIAIVNSFGNLAGFVAPYLVGSIKDHTGSTDVGMYALAASLLVGAGLTVAIPSRLVDR